LKGPRAQTTASPVEHLALAVLTQAAIDADGDDSHLAAEARHWLGSEWGGVFFADLLGYDPALLSAWLAERGDVPEK
jgi:hypothetical protein